MDRFETQVEIDQPPSVVYDFLIDDENSPLWQTNLLRRERVQGEEGEIGAVARNIFEENGRTVIELEETTAAQKNRLLAGILHRPNADLTFKNEILPAGKSRSLLKISMEYRPKNWLSRLFFQMVKPRFFKQQQSNVANLKMAIETLGD